MNRAFDVIVIGGGHAGCEAAAASARMAAQSPAASASAGTSHEPPTQATLGRAR